MINWTKELLNKVEHAYKLSKTPQEGLVRAKASVPPDIAKELSYSNIRRALARWGRPGISKLLGTTKPASSVEIKITSDSPSRIARLTAEELRNVSFGANAFREIKTNFSKSTKPLERMVFIPDVHAPFQDRRAVALACKIIKHFKPDYLIDLGDLVDMYCMSSFPKDADRRNDYTWEIEGGNEVLDEFDACGVKQKFITLGNHEARVEREVNKVSPALHTRVNLVEDLRLNERGWHVTPYKDSLRLGKLIITHDQGSYGERAAAQARDSYMSNVVIGHTHRMGITYGGNSLGEMHVGANFGWLGNAKEIRYEHKDKVMKTHCLGIGIGYMEPSGIVHLQCVPFIN